MTLHDWNDELGAELRRDAAAWDAAPSRRVVLPGPSRRCRSFLGPALALASVILITVALWAPWAEKPLERELGALRQDLQTLADAVWQRLPLRHLLE